MIAIELGLKHLLALGPIGLIFDDWFVLVLGVRLRGLLFLLRLAIWRTRLRFGLRRFCSGRLRYRREILVCVDLAGRRHRLPSLLLLSGHVTQRLGVDHSGGDESRQQEPDCESRQTHRFQ